MEMAATQFCCFPCFLHTAQALNFSKSSPASSILAFSRCISHRDLTAEDLASNQARGIHKAQLHLSQKKKKKLSHRSVSCAELSSVSSPSSEYPSAQKHLSIWISPKRNRGEKVRVCIAKGVGLALHLTPVCSPIKLLPMELFCTATSAANNSAVGGGMSPDSS